LERRKRQVSGKLSSLPSGIRQTGLPLAISKKVLPGAASMNRPSCPSWLPMLERAMVPPQPMASATREAATLSCMTRAPLR